MAMAIITETMTIIGRGKIVAGIVVLAKN